MKGHRDKKLNFKNISKKEIINQALYFHSKGDILKAAEFYKYFINQGFKDSMVFSNYAIILKEYGELKEAELFQRRAIKIDPNFANAHSNLGNLLREIGKLEEAEFVTRKAIKLKPDFAMAYSNLGIILKDKGQLKEAEFVTRKAIKLKPDFAMAYSNLGIILENLDKLENAEISLRKAIQLKPDLAEAYLNLGCILIDLGKLKEAELYLKKAIDIESNLTRAYFSLSTLKYTKYNKFWKSKLFSKNIFDKKLPTETVDIYFARANILHKDKKYEGSAKYLQLANELKLSIKASNSNVLINKTKTLLNESQKIKVNQIENKKTPESIFIVGMPRSGSTLLESILSINRNVNDLGEINILEEAFLEWKQSSQDLSLEELYWNKINKSILKFNITTNKWLYNYQYAGIIAKNITNAKIIHCHRNPLDNILSIYRGHFAKGNEYSSSLIDCTIVYLDQEEIMTKYKDRFRTEIYDLNYDLLVRNPKKEIKTLINWLQWDWDDSYLSPHLNQRSVSTASNVQVRFPINAQSIRGWKNYEKLLKPAIDILTKTSKYQNITS